MARTPRHNKKASAAPSKPSYAAEVFERDWTSFQLQKRAFEECDCKKAGGCSCFMQHAKGRALFADHCHLRRFLHAQRSEVMDKLSDAKRDCFWGKLSEYFGTCECISETCVCLYNTLHPQHAECYTNWTQRKSAILKQWDEKLKEYGIAPDHEEFGIGADAHENGFHSKEINFSASSYCPSSPVWVKPAEADAPLHDDEAIVPLKNE
jgi:hypothetical protein